MFLLYLVLTFNHLHKTCYHWQRKMTKSGGANLLTKQYFYCKNLKSYGALLNEMGLQPHSPTLSAAYTCYILDLSSRPLIGDYYGIPQNGTERT